MLIKKFQWDLKGDRWKIHKKIWESTCLPKSVGDLGFRDRVKFNEAMSVASGSRYEFYLLLGLQGKILF